MEIQQTRYFLALCDSRNFTRAAEMCGVTQPSLTKAIKKLEDEFGGALFRRERSLTHLTDLGLLLRPHMEAVYHASELARLEAFGWRNLDRAPVRLGMMCTIGPVRLVSFMKRLRLEIPSVEVNLTDAPGRDIVRLLMEGELDAAFIGLPSLPERFDSIPLYRERYTVAFCAGHRFEAMDVVPLKELDGENYLNRINCEYPDHFDALGIPDPAENVRVCYSTEREDWIQAMILAGLGCAVMPEFLPTLPGVATRPLVDPELSRGVALVTVSGRQFSPALRTFIELAKRHSWVA
ncbi:MAG: LysR family transcriptional regulator [Magnetospirillum sp.]|nr:LysR family transcriptional regulator [Magnetospirillum sp.]